MWKELISSSFSSSAFYSPPKLSDPAKIRGGARLHHSCIVTADYLVKKKVQAARGERRRGRNPSGTVIQFSFRRAPLSGCAPRARVVDLSGEVSLTVSRSWLYGCRSADAAPLARIEVR
jgi:hypothetical protein